MIIFSQLLGRFVFPNRQARHSEVAARLTMAMEEKWSVDKLDGMHWMTWKFHVCHLLLAKGLWGYAPINVKPHPPQYGEGGDIVGI